jgi:putative hemolysin
MSIGQFLLLHGWQLVLLAVLLAAAGVINACETGFFSLGGGQLYTLEREGRPLGRMVAAVLKMPRTLLTTVLLLNNVVSILYFVLSTLLLIQMEHTIHHGAFWSAIGAVVSLLFLVLVGDIIPKSLAYLSPRRVAEAAAPVALVLCRVVKPLHEFLSLLVINPLTRLIAPPRSRRGDLTAEEMEALLTLSQKRGLIGKDETALLQEVLALTDLRAGHIMVPRVDMRAMEVNQPVEALLEVVRRRRITKLPVYEGDLDHIIGVVYAKRVLTNPGKRLREVVTTIPFVPESARLETVLLQFRATRTQIAVVVDEYGGTAGMITLEDILEEIVGDIADEREDSEPMVQPIGPREWLVNGDMPIHEWVEAFPTELSAARYSTVGGFVLSLLGDIPRVGRKVQYHNISFTIEAMRRRRIALLRVALDEGKPR